MTAPTTERTLVVGQDMPTMALTRVNGAAVMPAPYEVAALVQQFDDEAFLMSVAGEAMEKWFYEFKIQGKQIEGVSAVGADEFARLRAAQGFPIEHVRFETVEKTRNGALGLEVFVVLRDVRTRAESIGMAWYPYLVERERNGSTILVPDNFPDRKALAVAVRNAILGLIPQPLIVAVLRARKAFLKTNEARYNSEVQQLIQGGSHTRQAAQVQPQVQSPPRQEQQTAAGPIMRMGRQKGTLLSAMSGDELTSAIQWCRDNNKFLDNAVPEMEAELESRRDTEELLREEDEAIGSDPTDAGQSAPSLALNDAPRRTRTAQSQGR